MHVDDANVLSRYGYAKDMLRGQVVLHKSCLMGEKWFCTVWKHLEIRLRRTFPVAKVTVWLGVGNRRSRKLERNGK